MDYALRDYFSKIQKDVMLPLNIQKKIPSCLQPTRGDISFY